MTKCKLGDLVTSKNGKYINLLDNKEINIENNNIEVIDMLIFEV